MKFNSITGQLPWGCILIFAFGNSGCDSKSASKTKSVEPAKVTLIPHEIELATITLTPDAEKRLGISVVACEKKRVQQRRTFGGEVIIPSGRSIIVSAPVSGIVKPPADKPMAVPGAKVMAGDIVLLLAPLLSPERDVPTPAEQVQMAGAKATLVAAQVTAQGDVQRSMADVEAARIALERASRLFADRAGSERAVDDAKAVFNVASTVLSAAEERYAELTKALATLENGTHQDELAEEITLRAPVEGIIRNLSTSAGQQVVGGAPLFEVLDSGIVWVRVPIFVDLLPSIPAQAVGQVVSLSGSTVENHVQKSVGATQEQRPLEARPIDAPPTADPVSASADLYFEVANTRAKLRPGQRVGIELPLNGEVEAYVVPTASILYDIYGGTWVYTVTEPHCFVRQRVTIQWIDGTQAVLQKGPAVGTPIVVEGAAELFGTEFGPGK